MSRSRPRIRRRLVAGLAPIALVLGALPLLAPTCGDSGEGFKTFARSSIIIPMDVCYQKQTDGTGTNYPATACPQTPDAGDVIKAYGLVYQLIRNGIAVYWVIDGQKAAIPGIDLTIQYAGGVPVHLYDWASPSNPTPPAPTASHAIDYRGGPFVVDGSDFARASQVLQNIRSTFQNVNVHVSNVAFRAYAKRTMAGGWSAGGAVAPKVALLDIGSTSSPTSASSGYAKNSEPIIRGYLARAGLDFAGAGGVATATGHGQIYDRLDIDDLLPSTPGDWTTTNLHRYGYQILWVPHWFAPGSCANASSQSACFASLYKTTRNDPLITDKVLATIGSFVGAGKDLFAECAGLGSFEGVPAAAAAYEDGHASTHFHVTNGLTINKSVAAADYDEASASSPLMQLGDYPFIPRTGAIQNFKPASGSTYTSLAPAPDAVKRLVSDASDPTYDYFTYRPPTPGVRGTTVYLGGHVYSGYADTLSGGNLVLDNSTFQIGGTRLVLNTLFNLGATCTASGVSCNTGQLGVCALGTIQCQNGQPVCTPTTTASDHEECNGLDDNCNGEVDEGLQVECYEHGLGLADPTLSSGGLCRAGVSSCVQAAGGWGMSACTGQVLPSPEVCNALDDDCNGQADEGLSQRCYEGPSSSIDPATGTPRPVCQAGTQTCSFGSWGACLGQVLPRPENCTENVGLGLDDDCNGTADDTCDCTAGQTRDCYAGPPTAPAGVGACRAGTQTCIDGTPPRWSECADEVLPSPEVCGNAIDEDCNGSDPTCPGCGPGKPVGFAEACASIPSAAFPGAQRGVGQCHDGTTTCVADATWGACLGETLPSSIEACDAVDNDCDGVVDDGAVCPASFVCEHGVCVPDACGVEIPTPEGYVCNPPPSQGGTGDGDGTVARGPCGDLAAGCPDGQACQYGSCTAACTPDQCAAGSTCGGGACVSGGCYATGCPAGEVCKDGGCVADPCADVLCPSGTFCRGGDCVQACVFVSCFQGEVCGIDGFCEADPCASVTCAPGQRCTNGGCAANPCGQKGCADGQTCTVEAGVAVCVDDPCAGITCPAGVCLGGQCFATSNPTGAGTVPRTQEEDAGGCGCGSGRGVALPALLALLVLPLARRRRRAPGGGLALLLVAVVVLGAACKKEDEFDPASCAETCGEQRCVDLANDPSHCGGCDPAFACGTGEICVEKICGPATAVAPFVKSLSPGSGPRGSLVPVTVEVAGERFVAGAEVRVESGSTTRSFPATFLDAGRLSVDLDLSTASPTTWRVRVVNPDHVISNARPFDVVLPLPSVTGVTPDTVTAGASTSVLLTGTNFTSTSQCHLRSTPNAVPETGLPSTVDAAGVHCTVDAAALPPGTYEIWVVNEGNLASNVRQLVVASAAAALTALSPSSGPENAVVSITVTGSGFDVASRVVFDGCAGPNDPPGCAPTSAFVGTTFVSPTTLIAALPLPDCAADTCLHLVSVRGGATGTTSALPFTVAADTWNVATFSPPTAYQGDAAVPLTFLGTNLPAPGAKIEVQPPGGAFTAALVTTTESTTGAVAGTLSLVGQPEGAWLARIDFGNNVTSSAWPLRVLSNQAILRDFAAAPAPERSGAAGTTKTSVTFQVANLRPPYSGVKVQLRGPGGFSAELDPSPDPTTATSPLTLPSLSLANLETGTYAFTVKNANASESNGLSFNVTPGAPTLSGVSPASHSLSAANPVVTVTLTGTNFAKPDASGNGGSVVHVTMIDESKPEGDPNRILVPDAPIPASDTTVVSRTQIQVRLDVRDGLAGAYDLQVWNPSLPTTVPAAPQKSGTLANAFTITP